MPPRSSGKLSWTNFIIGLCSLLEWPALMPSFDRDPYESRRFAFRLLILAVFLGWVLFGHFSHAAVIVTPDSPPSWNPAGSSGGSELLSELLKKPVGTGRTGYPTVPIAKTESVSAPVARGALRGVMRAGGWVMWGLVIVDLGGEFYNWLQCSTNQICKNSSARSDPAGMYPPSKYCVDVSSWGYGYCAAYPVDACALVYGADSYRAGAGYGTCYYAGFGGLYRSVTRVDNACPDGYGWENGACVSFGVESRPVTDSELENAAQKYLQLNPAGAINALRNSGAWDNLSTKRVYPEQTNVQGNPVTTQTPDGRTKTVTPGTKAREQPAPAGSTSNSTVVYNYNTTTITNADGSTETTVTEEDAGVSDLELPDDYAREDTLQEVRDALVKKPDPAPKPETATQPTQAVQTYFDLLKTIPIVDTIGGGLDRWETDFSGNGQCPTYDIPFYGHINTMTSHCLVGESIRSFLAAVLAVIYSVAAVRIFLSA